MSSHRFIGSLAARLETKQDVEEVANEGEIVFPEPILSDCRTRTRCVTGTRRPSCGGGCFDGPLLERVDCVLQ